jgi:hypothetical protein
MSCPAPIGLVPKEDCAAIAADFGALTVEGALPRAGSGKYAAQRQEAIRAVGTLAQSIKDQRVKLCERYIKCTVPLAEHDARDQVLTGAMAALIDLWNKRKFAGLESVARFREAVRAIDVRVNGDGQTPPLPSSPPRVLKAGEALARIEDPGVAFRVEGGVVTVSSTAEGKRDALLSKPDVLSLPGGHRYRLEVAGSYKPSSPALVQPGDELLARLKYRADGDASLSVALRSLEDPEAAESTESWRAVSGVAGTREVKLTADPQQTGFYLGVAVKGAAVEISELELLRGGKLLLAGRPGEPGTRTDCAALAPKPPATSKPLHCQPGEGDRVTLAQPEGYLILSLRDASGQRASTRALSLEGGRSLDAAVGNDARLVVTLVGPGTAAIERVEVTDLGR